MRTAEEIALLMAASGPSRDQQIEQTRFRTRLADAWEISEGARVLEVGCGQGDTTAVLADRVGPSGHVTAVDLADPSYGAPVTLGESARTLKEGPLGDRIDFRFRYDVLAHDFAPDVYDAVVLAHCTWYFDSLDRLAQTLRAVRPLAKRLCLSEWDLEPRSFDQFGHFLAVLIQGQVESFKVESEANVRSPYSREAILPLLHETGWEVVTDLLVETSALADGAWEVDQCLRGVARELDTTGVPTKFQAFLRSQLDVLLRLDRATSLRPLPAYAMVAERKRLEYARR